MNATPTEAVRESVRGFIASNFYVPDPSKLADEASLVESGIVDSTGILEVLTFLEQTFAIQVADAEVVPQNLDSIARIVAFIGRKRAPAALVA
jgi:acyl carrier protein